MAKPNLPPWPYRLSKQPWPDDGYHLAIIRFLAVEDANGDLITARQQPDERELGWLALLSVAPELAHYVQLVASGSFSISEAVLGASILARRMDQLFSATGPLQPKDPSE